MHVNFINIGNFPNILGCIDGIHVAIKSSTHNKHAYINCKGFHSMYVQGICDASVIFSGYDGKAVVLNLFLAITPQKLFLL